MELEYQPQLFLTDKLCGRCKKTKPLSEYRKQRPAWCRDCRLEYGKQHYRENKARYQEQAKRWQQSNPNRSKENQARWRKDNQEHLRAYKRKRARENPEIWANDCRKRRARKAAAPGDGATLSELRALHGMFCYLCNAQIATQVDHVVPLSKGGTNYPENLCPACRDCNERKGAKSLDEYLEGRESTK